MNLETDYTPDTFARFRRAHNSSSDNEFMKAAIKVDYIAHELIPASFGARAVQIKIFEYLGSFNYRLMYGHYNEDNSFSSEGLAFFSEHKLPLVH